MNKKLLGMNKRVEITDGLNARLRSIGSPCTILWNG